MFLFSILYILIFILVQFKYTLKKFDSKDGGQSLLRAVYKRNVTGLF